MGKRTLKTKVSLLSSFMTLAVLGVTTYLIGKDFFFNTNPKVLTGSVLPETTEPVYVNNSNFTIALRLEDATQNEIPEDHKIVYPYVWYGVSERTETNEVKPTILQMYVPKPCLEIEGLSLKGLEKFNLDTLLCIDLNQIRDSLNLETDLPIYGQVEEQLISLLSLNFSNCQPNPNSEDYLINCLSFEEINKRSVLEQYASVYLPRHSFNPENYSSPFTVYYENIYLKLSPFTEYSETVYYSTIKLSDDKGWIFEDIDSFLTFDLDRKENNPKFLQPEAFEAEIRQNLFELTLFFQRKQIILNRSYVKIQELAANLGGIMKVLFTFCIFINKFYASFKLETGMIAKHLKPQTVNIDNPNQSISRTGAISTQPGINIGIVQYLKIKLGFKEKLRKEAAALDSIKNSLDLENILKIEKDLSKRKAQEASEREPTNTCVIRNN